MAPPAAGRPHQNQLNHPGALARHLNDLLTFPIILADSVPDDE